MGLQSPGENPDIGNRSRDRGRGERPESKIAVATMVKGLGPHPGMFKRAAGFPVNGKRDIGRRPGGK